MTMFLTPEGDPFWGGAYFPPEPRWGTTSFSQELQGVADACRAEHEDVRSNTATLREALARMSAERPRAAPTPGMLTSVAGGLLRATDPLLGGMRGAPKFPALPLFRFLWQDSFRTMDGAGREAVHLLLRQMCHGGVFDHLGGGFARYSTDAEWLAPHFEKILYDNAQILELLALAHADSRDPLYAERAEETVNWMIRDMTAASVNGRAAFAASEDADNEGEEADSTSGRRTRSTQSLARPARRSGRPMALPRPAIGRTATSCAGSRHVVLPATRPNWPPHKIKIVVRI